MTVHSAVRLKSNQSKNGIITVLWLTDTNALVVDLLIIIKAQNHPGLFQKHQKMNENYI